jgi:hypothetical protein
VGNVHDKRDGNEAEIVSGLLAAGCTVRLNRGGEGWPDMAVGRNTHEGPRVWFLEVKVKGKRKNLTPSQVKWLAGWTGHHAVVETLEEALTAVGLGRLIAFRDPKKPR